MKLLGLRIDDHDSNITYYDGKTVRYYKSERDRQIKHHGYRNIFEWIDDVERLWGLRVEDIDEIAIIADREIEDGKLYSEAKYTDVLNLRCKIWQLNHHFAHALSTRFVTGEEADVDIVMDGEGNPLRVWSVFKGEQLIEEGSLRDHGSLGGYMAEVGRHIFNIHDYCGGMDIAGKLMGLQSYGILDETFYNTLHGLDEYTFISLFDFTKWIDHKKDHTVANLKAIDWIRTVHEKAGSILVNMFKKHMSTSKSKVTFSGGVAQNIIWNTALKQKFTNLSLVPYSQDDGLSLGAIEWLLRRNNIKRPPLKGFPFIMEDEAPSSLPTKKTIKKAAELLARGEIIGWYQGHGEIGPRALGNRSILANPSIKNAKQLVNGIKRRENYRPFGASILQEHKSKYFNESFDNPFMLFAYNLDKPNLESITHIDNTCRCQTVQDGVFYELIEEFYKLTGLPILLNTSLNVAGRPLASRIQDAKSVFYNSALQTTSKSQLGALFCGNNYLVK